VLEAWCKDVSNADKSGGQNLLQVLDPDYCEDELSGDELKQIVGFKGIAFTVYLVVILALSGIQILTVML